MMTARWRSVQRGRRNCIARLSMAATIRRLEACSSTQALIRSPCNGLDQRSIDEWVLFATDICHDVRARRQEYLRARAMQGIRELEEHVMKAIKIAEEMPKGCELVFDIGKCSMADALDYLQSTVAVFLNWCTKLQNNERECANATIRPEEDEGWLVIVRQVPQCLREAQSIGVALKQTKQRCGLDVLQ